MHALVDTRTIDTSTNYTTVPSNLLIGDATAMQGTALGDAARTGQPIDHPIATKIRQASRTPDVALDFFVQVLHPVPEMRCSALQAMQHPYLRTAMQKMLQRASTAAAPATALAPATAPALAITSGNATAPSTGPGPASAPATALATALATNPLHISTLATTNLITATATTNATTAVIGPATIPSIATAISIVAGSPALVSPPAAAMKTIVTNVSNNGHFYIEPETTAVTEVSVASWPTTVPAQNQRPALLSKVLSFLQAAQQCRWSQAFTKAKHVLLSMLVNSSSAVKTRAKAPLGPYVAQWVSDSAAMTHALNPAAAANARAAANAISHAAVVGSLSSEDIEGSVASSGDEDDLSVSDSCSTDSAGSESPPVAESPCEADGMCGSLDDIDAASPYQRYICVESSS